MNERIKELLTPKLKEWAGDSDDNFSEELEKFAELIVQECIDICLRNATAKDLDRWSAGVCAFDIQEHFGVD